MTARISVVIPCFNAAAFLPEALGSVSAQSRAPFEVLVVDDGSTDGSAELAASLGATVLSTGQNSGSAAARNLGLRRSQGDFVALLDADDLWEPDHLEIVAGLLERHPEAVLAFSRVRSFGLQSDEWPGLLPENEPVSALWQSLRRCILPQNTAILRRDTVLAAGGYDERYRLAEDFDLWLRLSIHHPFVCTHAVTAQWRRHETQSSRDMFRYWTGEYEARTRLLQRLRSDGSPLVPRVEIELREIWERHLSAAWHGRRADQFAFHLGMWPHVPGARSVRTSWARRGRLIPLARLWDALPPAFRSGIRRIRRADAR